MEVERAKPSIGEKSSVDLLRHRLCLTSTINTNRDLRFETRFDLPVSGNAGDSIDDASPWRSAPGAPEGFGGM